MSATPDVLVPVPFPSTVNRRVTFTEPDMEELPGSSSIDSATMLQKIDNNNEEYNAGKDKGSNWSSRSPSCLVWTSFKGKTTGRRVAATMTILFLVVLAVFLFLMARSRKR